MWVCSRHRSSKILDFVLVANNNQCPLTAGPRLWSMIEVHVRQNLTGLLVVVVVVVVV
jgi:hypothetical protein